MPDLLLELFCEEIPARMQRRAAAQLHERVTNALAEAGLACQGAGAFVTPRRLALSVHGVPAHSPDQVDERRGPRVGAPDKAIEGFLRGAGLTSIDEAKVVTDAKKGDYYSVVITRPGRPASEVIAAFMPDLIRSFQWPKSMRWGAASAEPGSLTWVRPLHGIVCVFGPESSETSVVTFAVEGIASGRVTHGHRFLNPEPIEVRRFDDYASSLERAHVIIDPDRRKDIILAEARDKALALGLELVEDDGLAEEVTGLVEWPVVMIGEFDEAFLDMPPEVIRTAIRSHQKCFVLRPIAEPQTVGADLQPADEPAPALANSFALVSNQVAPDGGAAIVAGNERVIRARLADARYFWETDQRISLADRLPLLDKITFHKKLGSQGERVRRIAALAREIAPVVMTDPDKAARAATLAKADLVTEMVGEFPELQGVMGKYYALAQGEDAAVAAAIKDHYRPAGPSDWVPGDLVTIAVALADKLDMLACFWAIDEKPTGSKDPFALRRAALGVIRLLVENRVRMSLTDHLGRHGERVDQSLRLAAGGEGAAVGEGAEGAEVPGVADALPNLLAFFADRLKVQLRDSGARADLVEAIFALGGQDDIVVIVRRVEALGRFLETDAGVSLLAGFRRAVNILNDEEKKAGAKFDREVDPALLEDGAEKQLHEAITGASGEVRAAVEMEDHAAAMKALAQLREPVDTFFDDVLVNADDPAIRANRLCLLNTIRETTLTVADFSRIAG